MHADFDLYVPRPTWMHRLDPRIKLLFVAEATLFTFLWPSLWTALAVVLLCTVLLWAGQIPARRIASVWRAMGVLSLMVFALTVLFGSGGQVLFRAGPVVVMSDAVVQGALLALRLLALALVFALWLFTTDQAAMVRGFVALHLPYDWGLTLGLALRYLPAFASLFEQVREAQQARGLDLEQASFIRRLQAYRPILIAMIIAALRNSERLGWALEARALDTPGVKRTAFRSLRLAGRDRLALLVLGAALVGGIVLRMLR